jgi:hypothetical protein
VALPEPVPGLIIAYAYLWRDQQASGTKEGRKTRPCAIILATVDDDGDRLVYVAPVTHSRPSDDADAVELPSRVKRHLGLDGAPSWIITSELNRFIWPGFDLRPISRDRPDVFAWGFLPVELFAEVKAAIARKLRQRAVKIVDRS